MQLIDRLPLLEELYAKMSELTKHRGGRQFLYGTDRYEYETLEHMEEMLESVPEIEDVAPVVHGKWERRQFGYTCSVCGARCLMDAEGNGDCTPFRYCYHCGAKMEGDKV